MSKKLKDYIFIIIIIGLLIIILNKLEQPKSTDKESLILKMSNDSLNNINFLLEAKIDSVSKLVEINELNSNKLEAKKEYIIKTVYKPRRYKTSEEFNNIIDSLRISYKSRYIMGN